MESGDTANNHRSTSILKEGSSSVKTLQKQGFSSRNLPEPDLQLREIIFVSNASTINAGRLVHHDPVFGERNGGTTPVLSEL